jgi:hypothetical protein
MYNLLFYLQIIFKTVDDGYNILVIWKKDFHELVICLKIKDRKLHYEFYN